MSDGGQDNGRPRGTGGPKTERGKAVSRANGIRHGLRSKLLRAGLLPKARHCVLRVQGCGCQERGVGLNDPCPALAGVRDELARAIRAQPHVRPAHAFLVDLLLDDVVAVLQARLWLATVGVVRIDGTALTMQSLEPDLARRKAEIRRLADRLGLTPAAMRELKLDEPLDVPSLQDLLARQQGGDADAGEGAHGG